MNIAFIPARGQSKTIVNKNLSKIGNYSLTEYSIRIAIKSNIFKKIVLSSDSNKILKIGKKYNTIIHKRSKSLSTDKANVADVVFDWLIKNKSINYKYLYLLQPTSPFLKKSHLVNVNKFLSKNSIYNSAQTISNVPHNSHAWNQRKLKNNLVSFQKKDRIKYFNKQLKPKFYIFGNLIAVKISTFLKNKNFFSEPSYGYEIRWPYSIDIDNNNDLTVAKLLFNNNKINLDI